MPPSYIRVRAVVWAYGRGQTDTQTHVTTIHFASSATDARCNKQLTDDSGYNTSMGTGRSTHRTAGAAANLWLPLQIPTVWLINLTVFTVSPSAAIRVQSIDRWLGPPLMINSISYEFPVLNDVLLSDNKANTDTGNW